MKKNALRLYLTKDIRYDRRPCTLKVTASLDDDCHNKHCDFSITCMVYLKNPSSHEDPCIAGGCDHKLIGKYFPELKKFFPLHLCTHEGLPMYPVENGIYHINKSGLEVAKNYLRISDSEYLKLAKSTEDKIYFAYQLITLGIVDRWKKEADEFIAYLEEKCGYEWENPYTPDTERFRLTLSEEAKKVVEKRIASGYYSDEAIETRAEETRKAAFQAQIDKVNERYNEETKKARVERDVALCILYCGISTNNYIYYNHNNTLVFNWLSHGDTLSREEFDRFVAEADYSLLPDGIKIEFKE